MGFFYCQVRKFGSITFGGNILPFRDYVVDYNWALNLFAQQKISMATARAILLACKKNVPPLLASLDRIQKEQGKEKMTSVVEKTLSALSAKLCPQLPQPVVDNWEQSFQDHEWRYKFLVLDGPSQTGKTMFCRSRPKDLSLIHI